MNRESVRTWLNNYIEAWKTYDPQRIRDLFSEDALYFYSSYHEPLEGREAILADWMIEPDAPGSFEAHYEPVAVEGKVAVANGRTRYLHDDGKTLEKEFDNIFVLHFDDAGRCTRFTEWYMRRPDAHPV